MRGWTTAWLLAGLLLNAVACNGGGGGKDPLGKDQVILDGVNGEGVIKRFSGISKQDETLALGKGAVVFDVQHVDRLVNNEVTIEVFRAGETAAPLGKLKGNETLVIDLPEGTTEVALDAHLVYEHSPITRHEGEMRGAVAHVGRNVRYKVKLEAPVGFLDLRFRNDGVDVGTKVTCDLFQAPAGEGAERGEPVMTGISFKEMLAVPAGTYDVKALYQETATIQRDAWIEGLVVGGGMARLIHEHDFAVTLHGFVLHVRNFGEDVSDRSTVYFYTPGANTEFAVALDQGPAGERLVVKPGFYDVRAVYQPGPERTTWGDKVLFDVAIGVEVEAAAAEGSKAGGEDALAGDDAVVAAEEAGPAEAEASTPKKPGPTLVEMEVDVEKPLGTIVVRPLYGGEDISDKAMLRVLYAGADKSAASAVLAVTGLSTHVIPAGDYDILVSYEEADTKGFVWFDDVHFEHGTVWEQEIDLALK